MIWIKMCFIIYSWTFSRLLLRLKAIKIVWKIWVIIDFYKHVRTTKHIPTHTRVKDKNSHINLIILRVLKTHNTLLNSFITTRFEFISMLYECFCSCLTMKENYKQKEKHSTIHFCLENHFQFCNNNGNEKIKTDKGMEKQTEKWV